MIYSAVKRKLLHSLVQLGAEKQVARFIFTGREGNREKQNEMEKKKKFQHRPACIFEGATHHKISTRRRWVAPSIRVGSVSTTLMNYIKALIDFVIRLKNLIYALTGALTCINDGKGCHKVNS